MCLFTGFTVNGYSVHENVGLNCSRKYFTDIKQNPHTQCIIVLTILSVKSKLLLLNMHLFLAQNIDEGFEAALGSIDEN